MEKEQIVTIYEDPLTERKVEGGGKVAAKNR